LATDVTLSVAEVDQVCVLGDRDRLKQLILNLVDNAISYTPAGGRVTMGLRVNVDGNLATITVADTGIGIPRQDLPHIFDRFYRVDKARTRSKGGSGLGLAIVKSITEAHQGHIEVVSEVGVGSTFTVQLPLQAVTTGNGAGARRVPA
jgi:two-component system phosphate regulon sensor histidine kinase PhoR